MGIFNRKKKVQEPTKTGNEGKLISFILLSEDAYDWQEFAARMKADWGIELDDSEVNYETGTIACEVEGMMIVVGQIGAPVPGDELISNAKTNYAWKDAVRVAENHKSHLIAAVMQQEQPLLDAAVLYVKLVASLARDEHVCGINALGSVLHPGAYSDMAEMVIKDGGFPIMNLVFVGIYSRDGGKTNSGYTYGLDVFGKSDIEVLDSRQGAQELYSFLYDIAGYVVEHDVTLKDGETIGFSAEQKLDITYSDGVVLAEKTLKIAF